MTSFRLIAVVTLFVPGISICCDLNEPGPVKAALPSLAADIQHPRQVLLSNNVELQVPDADGVLEMHSADNFSLLGQISEWPTPSGQISSIKAQPVVLDLDHDGITDALYVIDVSGRLWFIRLNSGVFSEPALLADFSQTQAVFRQPLQLVQVLAPAGSGTMQRQTMLLLTGSLAEGDILLAVKHVAQRDTPWQLTDLADRTQLDTDEPRYGIAEQLWQQIQQGGGWYVKLNQRVIAKPEVYAGVVYLTSAQPAAVGADCSLTADAQSQLHAFHLHHAGLVYSWRNRDISQQERASLILTENEQGRMVLSLQDSEQQQTVLTELLAIDASCADCVTSVEQEPFPRFIRLATFQTEQDAH